MSSGCDRLDLAEAQLLWPDNPRLAGVRHNLDDMDDYS